MSDVGQWLSREQHAEVESACAELSSKWKAEVAVLVLDALPAEVQPSAFAAALLNYWGVGGVFSLLPKPRGLVFSCR